MAKQLPWRLCVNLRRDRKVSFAMSHDLVWSIMCVCLGCERPPDRSAGCTAIEVSAVADARSDSTRPVALNDGTIIPLTTTPLVTSADITGANASLTEGQWVLSFTVTDDAAKRVHEFSKQHVGRSLANVVDGKVHGGTPRIAGAIIGNKYRIDGFNRADAERMATAINNGCRR